MNWIRENKFLVGFFAILIVGIGALGYLLYTAYGSFAEVSDNYNTKVTELKRLQGLTPYPDQENLNKLREQKNAYSAAIANLQTSLAALQFPVQPMTPEQFQDKLRASVSKTLEKAQATGVTLKEKDKFYLGFETYQTSLPKPDAAAPLGHQLQAVEFLVNQLLDARIDTLASISRTPLDEETSQVKPPTAAGVKSGAGGQRPTPDTARKLVSKVPVLVTFTAEQSSFRKWLNDVSTAKEQFYIVRLLTVKNENPKGPSRIDATAATETPATAPATAPAAGTATPEAAATPAANTLKFVVGTEKVEVTAKIDIVDFAPPAGK